MKITIEITSAELAQLVDHFHLKEVPAILDELHEDFEEDPEEPDIKPDPEPMPEPEPQPKPKVRKTKEPKPIQQGTKRRGSKPHPVDVKVGDEWQSFPSTKEAAVYLGCPQPQVITAISRGMKCRGHELRYSPEEADNDVLPRGTRNE